MLTVVFTAEDGTEQTFTLDIEIEAPGTYPGASTFPGAETFPGGN